MWDWSEFDVYNNTTSWATAFTDKEAALLYSAALLLLVRSNWDDTMNEAAWESRTDFLAYVINKLTPRGY